MIHHFYHIYADGQWMQPVSEHVRALKMGLIDNLDTFAIGLVGSDENRRAVIEYLKSEGIRYEVYAEALDGWEQVTQLKMWEFCQNNEGLMLYAHSKGASNPSDVNIRWRRSMIYWNVIRWQDCVEKLKEYETVGSHWIYPTISMPEHIYGNPMYGGNFYWARCELIRTWMRPTVEHRHAAEGWIGYKYVQKPWKLWDWTPYFPNTNHFADKWVDDPKFIGVDTGKSVDPIVLHNKQIANDAE